MRGKRRSRRPPVATRHVIHKFIPPPALNKSLQLILEVLVLLPREPWHGKKSTITLPRQPVARFAIFYLGLKGLLRKAGGAPVFRLTRCGEDNCQDGRLQRQP